MHFKALFPTKYLGSHDLNGKDTVLTIRRVIVEEIETERGKEKKPVVYFEETAALAAKTQAEEKRLVLNRTNAKTIAAIYGNELDAWTGKRVQLFSTEVTAFGKTVDAIRIRQTQPTSK